MRIKCAVLRLLLACLLTVATAASAWAVTITKPVPPPPVPPLTPSITAVTDGLTCPCSIAGHYATAQGTTHPYNWIVTPAGAATIDLTPDPTYRHTIRFMAVRAFARQNNYQSFTLTVTDTGDNSSQTITIYPISMDFVKTAPGGPGGTTLRTYTRDDPDRVVHAPKDRDDPDSDNTRDFQVEVTGTVSVQDMEFVTWIMLKGQAPNWTAGTGRIAITEYNGSSQYVSQGGCTPHPSLNPPTPVDKVYRITTPVPSSWNPSAPPGTVEGTVHTFTLKGDAKSSFWWDIEIDVGIRQYQNRIYCADGIGDSMTYTVPKIDIELDTMNETEEGTDANEASDSASAYLLIDDDATVAEKASGYTDLEFTMRRVLPEEDLPSGVYQAATTVVDANGANTGRVRLADSSYATVTLPLTRTANTQLEYMGYAIPESKSSTREDTRLRVRLEAGGTEVGGDTCRDSAYLTVLEGDVKCPRREAGGTITTPHTSGTDGNEFTYDSAATGTLTIEWKMAVSPDTAKIRGEIDGLLSFGMTDVGDSQRQWSDGALAYANSQWEFSGDFQTLPTNNSGFGKKLTQLTLTSSFSAYRSCEIKRDVEVFFGKNEANHPGGVAGDPNWYYYWSQTTADYGTHVFETGGGTGITYFSGGSWIAHVRPDASVGPVGNDIWGTARGIDLFAHLCRHEEQHRLDMIAVWGKSTSRTVVADDDHPGGMDENGRGDWLKDSGESAMSGGQGAYDPVDPKTYNDIYDYTATGSDPLYDCEDYCLQRQQSWNNGDANGEDWASPGMRHATTNDPTN
ncbi:MAG: hypothetical protein K8T90_17060 [Planctomycetes bacterium]|nr:hypothetical protein [Planctomycetota bacterium]